jgi:small subunit ribosomal protein S6
MNNYELTLILNPDLSSKFDDFQTKFEKNLTDIKFKINKLENIGRRQLAYSILNHNKGHYAIFQLEGPAEAALELESKLKYDTSVIRHLLLKVNSPSLEDSLLLVESREAKKSPQEEEKSQGKPKTSSVESNDDNESNEELKDAE